MLVEQGYDVTGVTLKLWGGDSDSDEDDEDDLVLAAFESLDIDEAARRGDAPSSRGAMIPADNFRKFIMRGNMLDLAVAVIIGIAFIAVVNTLVNDVIMQFIAPIFGQPNFDNLTFTLGDGIIYYGKFLTALVNFLIIAATIFVIVRSFEA